jgi:hypothetical protein
MVVCLLVRCFADEQDEFDKMRQEFFILKPAEKPQQPMPQFVNMDSLKTAFETDAQGRQVFRVRSVELTYDILDRHYRR